MRVIFVNATMFGNTLLVVSAGITQLGMSRLEALHGLSCEVGS